MEGHAACFVKLNAFPLFAIYYLHYSVGNVFSSYGTHQSGVETRNSNAQRVEERQPDIISFDLFKNEKDAMKAALAAINGRIQAHNTQYRDIKEKLGVPMLWLRRIYGEGLIRH